jgi:hydrogenase maturation protein HypF
LADAILTVIRKSIQVRGTVQGVGFRPFVYNLARSLDLNGFVLNSGWGVVIEVEGEAVSVQSFLSRLQTDAPPLALIDEVSVSEIATNGDRAFEIRASAETAAPFAMVPPDIATCDACVSDFTNPRNRRHEYPFTNCTNCGPRYTIIADVPYDRPFTTMAEFVMCPDCDREYHDPADRRFHAQPNACPVCGPHLELWDRERRISERGEALGDVRRLLGEGAIVAIKGLGGFQLACDAMNEAAVRRLRERKRRSDRPFGLMAPDLGAVEQCCVVSDAEQKVVAGPLRPLVILPRRLDCRVPDAVAPGNNTLGIMLPYTPLHHLLFTGDRRYSLLVMTSGNLREEPIASRNEEVPDRLHPLCDYFLLHNRRIQTRVDDSVVRVFRGAEIPIRRSRGFAPQPVDLGTPLRQVLATGGELKSTLCLTKDHYAILSQHIGDMENYETLEFFRETLEHMKRFFRVDPEAVAHDLHPGYLSTRFALGLEGIRPIGIQHHHAHVAACAAEHGIRDKVIGVAFDGTGFGTDGQVWGAEFLIADWRDFERRAHFRYVPMVGGDAAVRQPWRMALSYLIDAFGAPLPEVPGLAAIPPLVEQALRKGINTIQTSSCGRLFDAVAALTGIRNEANYEGQAAMELEAASADGIDDSYPFDLEGDLVDWRSAIRGIVRDIQAGVPPAVVSAKFHNSVAASIVEVCRRVRVTDGLNRVCLTGGSFQNWRLLASSVELLERAGFEVYWHRRVPPNDGGLALGQAVVANALLST